MFFDRHTALRTLSALQQAARPGGLLVMNVLIVGTTYLGMFSNNNYHLFSASEISDAFSGWHLLHHSIDEFSAPHSTCKMFATVIARKPSGSIEP